MPWPVLALGAAIGARHGVSPAAFAPGAAAAVLGAGAAAAARRAGAERVAAVAPALALVGVGATLAGPGLEGVRRWVALGPVRLNMSAALAPWLLAGLLSSRPGVRRGAAGLAVAAQIAHLAQPDAAQASALAAGALPLLVGGPERRAGAAVAALLAALAAASWTRPDPLPALDHVERIVALARDLGPAWLAASVCALLALFAPFAAAARDATTDAAWRASAASAAYLLAQVGATLAGHFPVPVLGAGAGPVLGWFALVALANAPDAER